MVAAGSTFLYEQYLKNASASKAAALRTAEEAINKDTVEEFIRLRDRLATTESLLDEHVALSQFFGILEDLTLESVRFSSLSLAVDEERTASVELEGGARSFNALAAQSAAFAGEKRIKRAIFSEIAVTPSGSVSFTLSAILDPRLVVLDGNDLPDVSVESETIPMVEDITATTTTP